MDNSIITVSSSYSGAWRNPNRFVLQGTMSVTGPNYADFYYNDEYLYTDDLISSDGGLTFRTTRNGDYLTPGQKAIVNRYDSKRHDRYSRHKDY